jgi:hypothetical protein
MPISWWVCGEEEFCRKLPAEQARMAAERLNPYVKNYFTHRGLWETRVLASEGMRGYWAGAGCDEWR